jgi:hypothetical protein
MAAKDSKYQGVRDDQHPSEGTWVQVVHDCVTPSQSEIAAKAAAVNTIWSCGNCSDKWKLILHGQQGSFGGVTKTELTWVRITPKGEDGE